MGEGRGRGAVRNVTSTVPLAASFSRNSVTAIVVRSTEEMLRILAPKGFALLLSIVLAFLTACDVASPPANGVGGDHATVQMFQVAHATGPLTIHPFNPRYFVDGSGRAIYLTGSHTWTNFQDGGTTNPPPVFDYPAYLDFLRQKNHNFFRLWSWEQVKWAHMNSSDFRFSPNPYARPGPGAALDGAPRFDVTVFNQAYFDRLRERVILAGKRGLYVSIMLFNGWSNEATKSKDSLPHINPWRGHPFNRDNNINGLNGDPTSSDGGLAIHTLQLPEIMALQERYVRKVIDTVNDLDNVLYEICNESDGGSASITWQYHMIRFIKTYEASQPKRHPVGMTAAWPRGSNADLFNSPADWISPNNDDNYLADPPPADGRKVIISDSDHLCGICGDRAWVWKSLTRGINPLLMDGYVSRYTDPNYDPTNPVWAEIRANLGYARSYAVRMNLAAMTPHGELASSGFCLADPGKEYLVYLPTRTTPRDSSLKRWVKRWFEGTVTVDLSPVSGTVDIEWFNPTTGDVVSQARGAGGSAQKFTSPFPGDAVLYVRSTGLPARR